MFCYSCGFLSVSTELFEIHLGHNLHLLLDKSSGTCGSISTPVITTCLALSRHSVGDKLLVLPVASQPHLLPCCNTTCSGTTVSRRLEILREKDLANSVKAKKYSRFSTLYLLTSQSLWDFYQWQKITQKSNPIKSKHKHAF